MTERARFIGRILHSGNEARVQHLFADEPLHASPPPVVAPGTSPAPRAPLPISALAIGTELPPSGSIVLGQLSAEMASIVEILAAPDTARADLYEALSHAGLDPLFPDDVMAETARLMAAPGVDDPQLVDLTHLPFVTIDAKSSRDLDQALFIERTAQGGYRVHYALADAAHFVPPKSAIFREALRRAASYYLPGLSVTMLPRELSEGIVSLNEGVPRRALTFSMTLDREGHGVSTEVVRARVLSRKKLSFIEVEELYVAPEKSSLVGVEITESLQLLREVGELLMRDAKNRHVVRYARRSINVKLDEAGREFEVSLEHRLHSELYNEQISLLCNAEGARILQHGANPGVQAIFRVHPSPDESRLGEFAVLTRAIALSHHLDPATWAFRDAAPHELLSDYLARLVTDPAPGEDLSRENRIAQALSRQAILVNVKSTFAAIPAAHFGVGSEVYARFSAPMREVVGVFVHKEIVELEGGRGGRVAAPPASPPEVDEALRALVVDAANRAKDTQRKVNDLSNKCVIDRILRHDLRAPVAERQRRLGTVMGITASKVHVALDAPALDVKLLVRDIGKSRKNAWLEVRSDGVELFDTQANVTVLRLGEAVSIYLDRRDEAQERWVLLPALREASVASKPSAGDVPHTKG